MANKNNSSPEDGLETSVQIIFLDLLGKWRIIASFVTLGIIIATVSFFTTNPRYSVSLTAQMGKGGGNQPLESTFLASRRIILKYSSEVDQKIETIFYERDLDERKRLTLEVKVTTSSPSKTLWLATNIVATLRDDHLLLLNKEKESNSFIKMPFEIKRTKELMGYYKDKLAELEVDDHIRYSSNIFSEVNMEYREWLMNKLDYHRDTHNKYLKEYENFTPTHFPLLPEEKNVIKIMPKVSIFISGILGGVFFGVLAAFVWRLLNGARKAHTLKNNQRV